MYEIISVLRQSAIVLDFDVLELIDEDSVKLIKIKAVLKNNWLLFITELHTKDYQKYSYHCQKKDGHLIVRGSIRNYLTERDVKNGKSIDIQNQLI